MIAATVAVACAVALSAVSEKAEATFPGKNGRIAYVSYDGNGSGIYTSNPNGSGKIAFESERDGNSEIYTMNPNGMSVDRLTNNPAFDFEPDSHLSRPQ